jgi:hypothetical protein
VSVCVSDFEYARILVWAGPADLIHATASPVSNTLHECYMCVPVCVCVFERARIVVWAGPAELAHA